MGEHTTKVDINKLMIYCSRAFEDLGAVDLYDDEDIKACVEEATTINEEVDLEELLLNEPAFELKPLPSSLKYDFLDAQQVKFMIISFQLDQEQEKILLDVL